MHSVVDMSTLLFLRARVGATNDMVQTQDFSL